MAKTQTGDFSSRALAKNVVFSVVAFVLNFFISFYITPRITGEFGSDTYGYLKLANDFASYAALFSIARTYSVIRAAATAAGWIVVVSP